MNLSFKNNLHQHFRFSYSMAMMCSIAALSGFVIVEPAPYDLLLTIGICLIPVFSPKFSKTAVLPAILIACIFIFHLISANLAANKISSLAYLSVTGYLMGSWILIVCLCNNITLTNFYRVNNVYIAVAVLSSMLSIMAYLGIFPFDEILIQNGRIKGFFKDPNVFAPFLIPPILLITYRIITNSVNITRIFSIFILTCGVILSFSRAAWLSFILSIFILIMFTKLKARMKVQAVIILSILVSVILLYIYNNEVVYNMIYQRSTVQTYDDQRFGTQAEALSIALISPLGVGPGQAHSILGYDPHSTYIRNLVETGWISTIALSSLVILSLYRLYRQIIYHRILNEALVMAISLPSLLITSFVIDTLHWRLFWFILALPWVNFKPTRRQR